MYIFLTTFNPKHYSERDVKSNQIDYLNSFRSWMASMNISDNYFFLDNSMENISDIVNGELLDFCWDLQDFGAVRPFVHLAKQQYSPDPDKGTTGLVRHIFNTEGFLKHDYLILILGRRPCTDQYVNSINNWLKDGQTNCLYFSRDDSSLSDEVFVVRKSVYPIVTKTLSHWTGDNYSELLEVIVRTCNGSKIVLL